MSKFINQPITLTQKGNFPYSFYYKQNYLIQFILRHWRESGQWWLGEPELFVYEVSTNSGLCELHYLPTQEQWILYRFGQGVF